MWTAGSLKILITVKKIFKTKILNKVRLSPQSCFISELEAVTQEKELG